MEKEPKRRYRLVPCASYDVERIESWLTHMARQGLHLEKDGSLGAILSFQEGSPRQVRYRLEPRTRENTVNGCPSTEMQEICADYGWEYVDSYSDFFIFRATSPHARELNTDLEIQAMTLKKVRTSSTFHSAFELSLTLYLLLEFLHTPAMTLAQFGLPLPLLLLTILIFDGLLLISRLRYLGKLRRNLKESIPMDHNKPWKSGAKFQLAQKCLQALLVFLLLVLPTWTWLKDVDLEIQHTTDFPGTPPIVTAAEVFPEGTFRPSNFLDYNTYSQQKNAFVQQLEWMEYGYTDLPDGGKIHIVLSIDYFEVCGDWMAQGLMRDAIRNAKLEHHFYEIDAPDLGFDEIYAYRSIYTTYLIRHGDIFLKAQVNLKQGEEIFPEVWAEQMAERLLTTS